MLTKYKYIKSKCIVLLPIFLALYNIKVGKIVISWYDIIHILFFHKFNNHLLYQIIWKLRIPHTLAILISGFSLSISGSVMQGLFRNPLSDPSLLGVSSGSQFFIVICWILGAGSLWEFSLWMPLSSLIGGMLSILLLFYLSKYISLFNISKLLLLGIILNMGISACSSIFILQLTNMQLQELFIWNMGGIIQKNWHLLGISGLMTVISFIILTSQSSKLDLLILGEIDAIYSGVDIYKLKRNAMIGIALSMSASVSLIGPIVFIGLIVPHIMRIISGSLHKKLIWHSGLAGSSLLLLTDNISRSFFKNFYLPLGIIISLYGVPIFLFIMFRYNKEI